MMRKVMDFLHRDEGAVTVDFVVITAVIVMAALGVITLIVTEGALHGRLIAEIIESALRS